MNAEPNPQRPAADTPAEALAAVVDSATALARAELKLAAAEARSWLVRAGWGLTLLWLSLLLVQVAALLIALTPVLSTNHSISSLAWMLALALLPALAVFSFAVRELRRLKATTHAALDTRKLEHH